MHTNSFWLDVAQQWMFSLRDHDAIWSVDRDPSSSTEDYVIWELDGTGAGGDFTFVSGGYDEAFDGQHHAHWGPVWTLELECNAGGSTFVPSSLAFRAFGNAW